LRGFSAFGFDKIFIINNILKQLVIVCIECKCEIIYKSIIGYNNAIKNKSVCRKCASSGEKNGMYGRNGSKNPFFGKKHNEKTIEKLKIVDKGYTKTENFRKKISTVVSGSKNPMFGKSIYSVWVEKYGSEEANKKMLKLKKKHSKNNSGEGNPMYGKMSPTGSGNGWSGWYKGWYFRSFMELTYMIKIIERFNLNWESGELKKYKIEYIDYKGNKRNYFPDFVINNKYVVESKPKRLWNSDNVKRKKEAAIKFCSRLGLKYKLVDVGKLSDDEINKLYKSNLITFIPRYEIKYKKINNA
jgi:hypothetical protein